MKKFSFLILLSILCAVVIPAMAQQEEPKVTVNVNGAAEMYLVDINGLKFGNEPKNGKNHDEIAGAEISNDGSDTTLTYPNNNTYLLWLNNTDPNLQDAFNAQVITENWTADILQLIPLEDNPTMILNAPQHYVSDDGPLFEKLTIIAHPDEFPAMTFKAIGSDHECSLSIDPTFALYSASEALLQSESEMVFTLFPEEKMVSLWIAALNSHKEYTGNKFIMNTQIQCTIDNQIISAQPAIDNFPILEENGIFYIDFNAFLAEKAEFFEGDLDGDDIYETVNGGQYFDFTTSIISN